MKPKTKKWDVVDYLKTEEDQAMYLEASIEEANGDAAFIAKAIGDIARARGMTQVANDTGLSRESLYKALSEDGNPSFGTVLKVLKALDIELHTSTKFSIQQPSLDDLISSTDLLVDQHFLIINKAAQELDKLRHKMDELRVQIDLGQAQSRVEESLRALDKIMQTIDRNSPQSTNIKSKVVA